MNDKSNPDGTPRVIYLQDVLDQKFGIGTTKVILPITDPYVVHHGALGSFATIFYRGPVPTVEAQATLSALPGVETVLDRETPPPVSISQATASAILSSWAMKGRSSAPDRASTT